MANTHHTTAPRTGTTQTTTSQRVPSRRHRSEPRIETVAMIAAIRLITNVTMSTRNRRTTHDDGTSTSHGCIRGPPTSRHLGTSPPNSTGFSSGQDLGIASRRSTERTPQLLAARCRRDGTHPFVHGHRQGVSSAFRGKPIAAGINDRLRGEVPGRPIINVDRCFLRQRDSTSRFTGNRIIGRGVILSDLRGGGRHCSDAVLRRVSYHHSIETDLGIGPRDIESVGAR